jgi:hypothetical protein
VAPSLVSIEGSTKERFGSGTMTYTTQQGNLMHRERHERGFEQKDKSRHYAAFLCLTIEGNLTFLFLNYITWAKPEKENILCSFDVAVCLCVKHILFFFSSPFFRQPVEWLEVLAVASFARSDIVQLP